MHVIRRTAPTKRSLINTWRREGEEYLGNQVGLFELAMSYHSNKRRIDEENRFYCKMTILSQGQKPRFYMKLPQLPVNVPVSSKNIIKSVVTF